MCFFVSVNFNALRFAKSRGLETEVYEKMVHYLAEQERLFVKEQAERPVNRRKRPGFYEFHIAEKMYCVPAYAKPHQVVVGPGRQMQIMRWGLVPRRASQADMDRYAKGNWFVNANGENIFTQKTWPYYQLIQWDAEHKHPPQRCLIPTTGFIEYHHFSQNNIQPYYIEFEQRQEFMMAGLYEVTPVPDKCGYPGGGLDLDNPYYDNYRYTFTQLTTDATPDMAELHNALPVYMRKPGAQQKEGVNYHRMPLILREQDEQAWLNPDTPMDKIRELIRPYDEFPIKTWPISKQFRNINPLSPESIRKEVVENKLNFEEE